jgi:hypothetical protein
VLHDLRSVLVLLLTASSIQLRCASNASHHICRTKPAAISTAGLMQCRVGDVTAQLHFVQATVAAHYAAAIRLHLSVPASLQVAIEGCCHGELDNIYATLAHLEKAEGRKVDLLICCGDFQVRSSPKVWG